MLLVAAWAGASNLRVENGAIIEDLGEINFIRGVLVLHYTIDIKEIGTMLGDWGDHYAHNKGTNISHWRQHTLQRDTGACRKYLDGKRSKRGLLDIGGEVLHVLFGTATDDQVGKLKDVVRVQSVKMHKLHQDTNKLIKDMERYREAMKKEVSYVHEFMLLTRLVEMCHKYDRMIDEARINQLDLSPFNLSKINVEMNKFRTEIGFPPVVEGWDPNFRSSVKTSVAQGKHILVSILFSDAKAFTHYRIQSFPMFSNISSINKFSAVVKQSELIVNKNKSEIGFPSLETVRKCIWVLTKALCPPFLLHKVDQQKWCELALVQNSSELCEFRKHSGKEWKIVKTNGHLIITGEPDSLVHVRCQGTLSFMSMPSSGVAMVGDQCSVQGKAFRFPNMERRDISLTLNQPKGLQGFVITQRKINQKLEELLKPHTENFWETDTPQETFSVWGTASGLLLGVLLGGICVGHRVWAYIREKNSLTQTQENNREGEEAGEESTRGTREPGNEHDPQSSGRRHCGSSKQASPSLPENNQAASQSPPKGGKFLLEMTPTPSVSTQ